MAKRYAIKIGEIHLISDKPITEERRIAALKELEKYGTFVLKYFDMKMDFILPPSP